MKELESWWPRLLADHTELRDRLVAAYAAPHRGYHNTRHLAEVLQHVDVLVEAEPAVDQDAVVLAAWFHDAIYDTGGNNEERSAQLAERELETARVRPDLVGEVTRLVRLTTSHQTKDDDLAGHVLCDADLAILAADDARYEEYVAGVRHEYAALSETVFASSRSAVLRNLLDRPWLFRTAYGRDHWDQAARRNVEKELAELSGHG